MTDNNWAIVRQVVLATNDIAESSAHLRDALGLPPGFADPLLEDIGLTDETIRVGDQAHLELVAPLTATAPIQRWLAEHEGGGGYALSIQVPDIERCLAAAAAEGIAVAADLVAYGHRIVQLHPRDMGLLVELDEITDPKQWFWDDVPVRVPDAPRVEDILAVDIESSDPQGRARRWARVFDVAVQEDGGAPSIALGTRTLRFVTGERGMITAVELAAAAGSEVPEVSIAGVSLRTR